MARAAQKPRLFFITTRKHYENANKFGKLLKLKGFNSFIVMATEDSFTGLNKDYKFLLGERAAYYFIADNIRGNISYLRLFQKTGIPMGFKTLHPQSHPVRVIQRNSGSIPDKLVFLEDLTNKMEPLFTKYVETLDKAVSQALYEIENLKISEDIGGLDD